MNVFEHTSGRDTRYRITLVPKSHAVVERFDAGTLVGIKTFYAGDVVEYDSFNLRYTGPILTIGAKTISVRKTGGEKKMMKPSEFAWRNWDLDLAALRAQNAETSLYI